jgi:hypothetical protein
LWHILNVFKDTRNGYFILVQTQSLSFLNTWQLSNVSVSSTPLAFYYSKWQIPFDGIYGGFRPTPFLFTLTVIYRERPDTIRSIVANLVGDDESGDSLVDENEPIQPLQNAEIEDYTDPNWDPEPIDAGPGK